MRRRAAVLGFALAIFLGLMQPAPPAAADGDGGVPDAGCTGSGCSVSVQFSGTGESQTPATNVQPDCWYADWASVREGFVLRVVNEFLGWSFPDLAVPLSPVAAYRDALERHNKKDDWRWYRLHCKEGIRTLDSEQALSVAENTRWFNDQVVARQDLLVGPATDIPAGVSVKTLVEAAQAAFTIPAPVVAQNPTITDADAATLVNLDTWFWAEEASESYTITASAGPVSVTLEAKNTGYVLTSPFGSTQCTHEQFTTAWSRSADRQPDAGCRLAFDKPSPQGSAGHDVQISSTWEVTWSATGIPGPNSLDPITPSSTITVPVVELPTEVTEVR